MLTLGKDEIIILTVRKHWFVVTRTAFIFFIFILIPPLFSIAGPYVAAFFEIASFPLWSNFFLAIYVMTLFLFLFLVWMDYYLDMWIVTNQRIIDIEQNGLFNRTVSEIPISHVQNVTIEVRGFIETFLKFGTIRVQTAGEREFIIRDIPNLYKVKDVILQYAGEIQKNK